MRNNKNYNINIICNIKLTILQEKAKHLSIYYNTIVITAVMRLKKLITMMIDNNMVKNFFTSHMKLYQQVIMGERNSDSWVWLIIKLLINNK